MNKIMFLRDKLLRRVEEVWMDIILPVLEQAKRILDNRRTKC